MIRIPTSALIAGILAGAGFCYASETNANDVPDRKEVEKSPDPYPWVEDAEPGDLEIIIVGDINIQHRDHPAEAFSNVQGTLSQADLRYANMEGLYGQTEEIAIPAKSNGGTPIRP